VNALEGLKDGELEADASAVEEEDVRALCDAVWEVRVDAEPMAVEEKKASAVGGPEGKALCVKVKEPPALIDTAVVKVGNEVAEFVVDGDEVGVPELEGVADGVCEVEGVAVVVAEGENV
jgi:hypothetical protein